MVMTTELTVFFMPKESLKRLLAKLMVIRLTMVYYHICVLFLLSRNFMSKSLLGGVKRIKYDLTVFAKLFGKIEREILTRYFNKNKMLIGSNPLKTECNRSHSLLGVKRMKKCLIMLLI